MIFGILLEILINLKGTSVVMSTIFPIDWRVATVLTVVVVLGYSYFGGLWTSVMTGTINAWTVTVLSATVVVAVFAAIPGGATAVFDAARTADPANMSILKPEAAWGFGITLAFGLLAATVADQTFWQKVWAIRPHQVGRTFLWAGALFYPIPICLGMLGLVAIAYGLTPADVGGDIVAVGPYLVSHIGLPTVVVLAYVTAILAACYSTIDGASSAYPRSSRSTSSSASPRARASDASLHHEILDADGRHHSRRDRAFGRRLHLACPNNLCPQDFHPAATVLAILWPRTNTAGFVGGIVLSILCGMTLRALYGELVGTLSILAISGGVVLLAGLLSRRSFDMAT